MPDILLILLGTVVANYLVLSGQMDQEWRPAADMHREAGRLAILSASVMLGATLIIPAAEYWILVPLAAQSLQLLVLVAAVSGTASLASALARMAGIALSGKETALGAANGAALFLAWQVAAMQIPASMTIFLATFFAVTLAAAFGILLLVFAALMERTGADVPVSFRGPPLALIVAGLMALALLGLTGLLPD